MRAVAVPVPAPIPLGGPHVPGDDLPRERTYHCDAPVFSCATAEGGRYVLAGDSQSSIYCFDAAGTGLWKLGTGCGSAYSMRYHDERLYVVTTSGHLACIDASEPAIRAAEVVQCVEDHGRLRIQVLSPGYRRDWAVQFPKGIREVGGRYVVTEVREAGRGGFHRAFGDIRRLR
ncbi:PQQ-binding-like beta-propeller repeat protein [Micromonospora thermarum]|uniref:PQQ-binding-like beta-propeller repeat protein n=1 Tax=Micromonospora thermarum TaxID=2720024 RepID=UPI0028152859|nr:PQQ-binding-like beta-propeller repeat protein [Micromonospora thermarum]